MLKLPIVAALVCALPGFARAKATPFVSVEASPDLDCPAPATMNRLLNENDTETADGRDASDRSGDGRPAWVLRLEPRNRDIELSLRNPGGAVVVARVLAADRPACEKAAQAIGIIVTRYFREIAWTPGVEKHELPRATGGAQRPGQPGTATAVVASRSWAQAFAPLPRLTFGAGAAYWSRPDALMLAIDASARLVKPIGVAVGVLLPAFHTDALLPNAGKAQASGVPVIARVVAGGSKGRFSSSIGVGSVLTFEQGETRGIPVPATARRSFLALGVTAQAAVSFGQRLRLVGDLEGFHTVAGRAYVVQGVNGTVLDPPPWQAILGLRLEWALLL